MDRVDHQILCPSFWVCRDDDSGVVGRREIGSKGGDGVNHFRIVVSGPNEMGEVVKDDEVWTMAAADT